MGAVWLVVYRQLSQIVLKAVDELPSVIEEVGKTPLAGQLGAHRILMICTASW